MGKGSIGKIHCLASVVAFESCFAMECRAQPDAATLVEQADAQMERGAYGDAIGLYLQAHAQWPDPGILEKVAVCYRSAGQWGKAEIYYRMYAASLPPGTPVEDLVRAFLEPDEARRLRLEAGLRLRSLAPLGPRKVMVEVSFVGFLSELRWGPGHALGLVLGLDVLALDPVLARIGIGFASDSLTRQGNDLVLDFLVAIRLPAALAGRIVFSMGAITGYRNVWRPDGQTRIAAIGAAVHGRFHFATSVAFVVELDACPLLVFGSMERQTGFEIVVRGGLAFG